MAPGKSFLFSTCDSTRKWLRGYAWPGVDQAVTVALSIRDLGAMLNTARRAATAISKGRLKKGINTLTRISCLPHSREKKEIFVNACAHNQALYGCEACHVDGDLFSSYISHTAKAIGYNVQHKASALVFSLAGAGHAIDPHIQILMRRANKLRAMATKWPSIIPMVDRISHFTAVWTILAPKTQPLTLLLHQGTPIGRFGRLK